MNESKLAAAAVKYALEPQEVSKISSILELPEIKECGVLDYFIINCYTIIGYFAKDMKVS